MEVSAILLLIVAASLLQVGAQVPPYRQGGKIIPDACLAKEKIVNQSANISDVLGRIAPRIANGTGGLFFCACIIYYIDDNDYAQ